MNEILDHFRTDEQTIQEWRLFIGHNADYYIDSWIQIRNGQFFTFNIYAFVFSIFWMLHRQLLRPAVLFLSIFFAEGYLEKILFLSVFDLIRPEWWLGVRIFIFSLLLGFIGNWIYLYHTESNISEIKQKHDSTNYHKMIQVKGGTSMLPVLLFIIILISSLVVNYIYHDLGISTNMLMR